MKTLADRHDDNDERPEASISVKVPQNYMSQVHDDAERIRESLAELQLESTPEFVPAPIPIVTHTAEALDQPRVNRLGLEKLTHAPLNFRVFPETPYSIDEFQVQIGKRSSLGKGAMGNVQLVRWLSHPDKPLRALKRISKFQMWKDDNPIVLFEQLWDEIEALMTLKHKHIIGLDGYFEDYKYVYLIMEYAPNGDLNQLIENQKRLSELEAARHIEALIKALLFCHQHSYLHRDIKPENLLISSKGDLLLADFGCVATRHSTKKSLCGTRYYHSYEMANEKPHDAASDAWSVGVVTFELLHGKSPFESDNESESESESEDLDKDSSSEEDNECTDEYEATESEDGDDEAEDNNNDDEVDEDEDNEDGEDDDMGYGSRDQSEYESEMGSTENSDARSEEDTTESEPMYSEDDILNDLNELESGEQVSSDHSESLPHTRERDNGNSSRHSAQEQPTGSMPSISQHIRFDDHGNAISNTDSKYVDEKDYQSEEKSESSSSSNNKSSEASSEDANNVEKIYTRIRNLDYSFPEFFSDNAIDFISRLLQKEKDHRMTLEEALNHPFITQLHRLNSIPS